MNTIKEQFLNGDIFFICNECEHTHSIAMYYIVGNTPQCLVITKNHEVHMCIPAWTIPNECYESLSKLKGRFLPISILVMESYRC